MVLVITFVMGTGSACGREIPWCGVGGRVYEVRGKKKNLRRSSKVLLFPPSGAKKELHLFVCFWVVRIFDALSYSIFVFLFGCLNIFRGQFLKKFLGKD